MLYGITTMRAAVQAQSLDYFFKQQEVERQISFFSAHIGLYNTVLASLAVAAKLSVRDTVKVRRLGALVRDLNPHHIFIDAPPGALLRIGIDTPLRIHDLLRLLETRVQEYAE